MAIGSGLGSLQNHMQRQNHILMGQYLGQNIDLERMAEAEAAIVRQNEEKQKRKLLLLLEE